MPARHNPGADLKSSFTLPQRGPLMTVAEILLLDFDTEIANTRRILERIPETDPQWKPHEKSMPVGRLALHVARLPDYCTRLLTTSELDMSKEKFPDLIFES